MEDFMKKLNRLLVLFTLFAFGLTSCEKILSAANGYSAWNYDFRGTRWKFERKVPAKKTVTHFDGGGIEIKSQVEVFYPLQKVTTVEFSKTKNKKGYYTVTVTSWDEILDIPANTEPQSEGNIHTEYKFDMVPDFRYRIFNDKIEAGYQYEGFVKGTRIDRKDTANYEMEMYKDRWGQTVYNLFLVSTRSEYLSYSDDPVQIEGSTKKLIKGNIKEDPALSTSFAPLDHFWIFYPCSRPKPIETDQEVFYNVKRIKGKDYLTIDFFDLEMDKEEFLIRQ